MQSNKHLNQLESPPEQQRRRCAQAINSIQREHWPAAACSLRVAAQIGQEWAAQANQLAAWCEEQRTASSADSASPTALARSPTTQHIQHPGKPTLEFLEAGLTALAHFFGPEHATAVRKAMSRGLAGERTAPATRAITSSPLPAVGQVIGSRVCA